MAGTGRQQQNHETVERITTVDEQLLHALSRLHYLTAEQLTRLLYSKGSLTYVREQLKRFYDQGHIDRTFGPRKLAAGKVPYVYFLSAKGRAHVEDNGDGVPRRTRASEQRALKDRFLLHTLAINDVLIAAHLLTRERADLELRAFRHDLDLKRHPVKVEVPKEQSPDKELQSVVPDAWIDFRLTAPDRDKPLPLPLLIELDRNTVPVRDFKRKIRALVAYLSGPYEQAFGVKSVTVTFVVDQGAFAHEHGARQRMEELKRWTEEALGSLGLQSWGELFLFTSLPRGDGLDPVVFFSHPVCRAAFSHLPLSLLDLPERVS